MKGKKYLTKKLLKFSALGFLAVFFIFAFGNLTASAIDLTSSSFIIKDPIVGTGGGYGESTNFKLISAGNTTLSGVGDSASFITHYGFLYYEDQSEQTITFDIDATSADTCGVTESGTPYIVALGTITTTDTRVSGATDGINNICVDLDTNASGGAIVTVRNTNGASGLISTSAGGDGINSTDGSVGDGTENYGLCIVSTSSSTGTLDDAGPYDGDTCAANSETNNVQALSASGETIFDTNGAAITVGRGQISVNASISSATPAHSDYADTLTFIATGTF